MGECRDCAYSDRPTCKWPCCSCRDTNNGRSMYCPEDDEQCAQQQTIQKATAADVVKEEDILKFYYVRSIDEFWIGRRLDTLYYARYESESQQWVWTHSHYLPWGEHVVSPTSLWKEYTYPSEPEEIPFTDWLQGFVKKHIAADVRPVVREKWIEPDDDHGYLVDIWAM